LFTGPILAGGKVIHQLRDTNALMGALSSLVNNFGKRIRDEMFIENVRETTHSVFQRRGPTPLGISKEFNPAPLKNRAGNSLGGCFL